MGAERVAWPCAGSRDVIAKRLTSVPQNANDRMSSPLASGCWRLARRGTPRHLRPAIRFRGATVPTRPRWETVLLIAAGAVGLVVFGRYYRSAFPQSAVPIKVTRPQALEVAGTFLNERGADLQGYRDAVQFAGDGKALVFLQRTVGLDEANRWARDRVPIWTWNLRWFQPRQKEEWQVQVGVDGKVVQYQHLIEEAASGADLPQDSALALAERF